MKTFYKYSTIVLLLLTISLFIFSSQQRYDAKIRNKEIEITLNAWSNYIDSVKVKTNAYKDTIESLRQELKSKANK